MNRRDLLRTTAAGMAASLSITNASAHTIDGVKVDKFDDKINGLKTLATRMTMSMKVEHPFICAGMSFVCEKVDLCIAVSNAGGVGALSASLLSPAELESKLKEIKTATSKPFHVNFISIFPHEKQLDVCIEQQVPIISFHFGTPSAEIVKRLQNADIKVWSQVGSVNGAQQAHAAGVDGIVAQGGEAGGHTYDGMPIMALLPAIRNVVGDTQVFAAGGIADGRTAAAALAAGADAIWVGTLMVATQEANAHPEYQKRIVEASSEQSVVTHVYGPEHPAFNPMRILNNDTVTSWQDRIDEIPKDRSAMDSIGTTLFAGKKKDVKPFDSFVAVPETTGDFSKMPLLAGQGVGLVNSIQPAKTVVNELMHDAAGFIEDFQVSVLRRG